MIRPTDVELNSVKGAPQLEFLAGRPNATAPAVMGLIPEPQDPVDMILDRFADAVGIFLIVLNVILSSFTQANFTAEDVVSLLVSVGLLAV